MDNQEMDTGYTEFMEAFDEDFSNQTEFDDEGEQGAGEETGGDGGNPDEGNQPDEDGRSVESKEGSQPEESGAEQPSPAATEEIFTLKINKEERTCTREEVISLAQKGADYDRVRDRLNSQQETMDLLTEIAKQSDTDIPGLLDTLRLNLLKKQGISEDVAKERLAREKLERENAALKAAKAPQPSPEETPKEKARREVAEFQKAFPDVSMTDELSEKLKPDIIKGFSMLDAYRRMKDREQQERIKELEAQLAAKKQNSANRTGSPGSQKDSGGRRTKSDFDDFMRALE